MMKTTALVALVALGSLTASRGQEFFVDDPYQATDVPAVTGGSCTQNAPSDVQNPAGAIVSGTMCYKCAGNTETFFDINGDAMNIDEDSVGCYCEDDSECLSWSATETEENPDCLFDEDELNPDC